MAHYILQYAPSYKVLVEADLERDKFISLDLPDDELYARMLWELRKTRNSKATGRVLITRDVELMAFQVARKRGYIQSGIVEVFTTQRVHKSLEIIVSKDVATIDSEGNLDHWPAKLFNSPDKMYKEILVF
jgi:hypothetical protein